MVCEAVSLRGREERSVKHGNIVEIDWIDSCGNSYPWIFEDSFDFDSHDKSMEYKTVGYFIRKTKVATYVCLSMRTHEEHGGTNLGHLFSIPNVAIKAISVLKKNVQKG